MYENYIFDLYGTLVDIHTQEDGAGFWKAMSRYYSMQGAAYTARELKKTYRQLVEEEEAACIGKSGLAGEETEILLERVFKRLYERMGRKADKALIRDTGILFRTLSLKRLQLFEGAEELLDELHRQDKKIYLLSNAQRLFTEPEMRMLGIYDKFDGILYSSDAGVKKPSRQFFDSLFQQYGLKKQQSVMIGNDGTADIRGAHDYGMDSIYIHTSQSPERVPLPQNCREIKKIGEVLQPGL